MAKKKKAAWLLTLEFWVVSVVMTVFAHVPLWCAYPLARGMGRCWYYLDRRHRQRTVQHLLHSGLVKDLASARRLARANFAALCQSGVDFFCLNPRINPSNVHSYIRFAGDAEGVALTFGPQRAPTLIALTAHLGNWELSGIAYSLLSQRPMVSVMRDFDNPRLGRKVIALRTRFGHEVCSKEGAMKHLLVALKRHTTIGLLVDQHASREEGVETLFFGHPARTHASPAMLHLRTGLPIVMAVLRRRGNGAQFEMTMASPIRYTPTGDKVQDIQNVSQEITSRLELLIRETPEQWLWAHRRWLDINRKGWKPSTPDQTI